MTVDVTLFYMSTVAYLASWVAYVLHALAWKKQGLKTLASYALYTAVLTHAASIAVRGLTHGYFPIASLYETLVFLSLFLVAAMISARKIIQLESAAALVLAGVVALNLSTLFLNRQAGLMPSLTSMWLIIHVPFGIGSYALFFFAFILGLLYFTNKGGADTYYCLIKKSTFLGETFLLFCLITGAVWAQFEWGSFWGWDPKETWSLITLLAYAPALALFTKNHGRPGLNVAAEMAAFAFVAFNYLGVPFLMTGLHSYV